VVLGTKQVDGFGCPGSGPNSADFSKLLDSIGLRFGTTGAIGKAVRKTEVFMRTLVIGVVIAIVFLATYFVSTMQRVW
jgi:hypothetical protein